MNTSTTTLNAENPQKISKKGWKKILLGVKDSIKEDHIQVVSAGVAFYIFLALLPILSAAISIYGLVSSPSEVQDHLTQLASVLPGQAHEMISEIVENLTNKADETLGWSLALSIFISLFSANKATTAIFEGINVAYNEVDERNIFKKYGITLLTTLAGIIVGLVIIALVVAYPAFIDNTPLPGFVKTMAGVLRWPLLAIVMMYSIGVLYKIAPHRKNPKKKWVTHGAIIATVLWILGSLAFTFYISNFGNYDKTYGSLAAVIILMLWFFLSSFFVLIGAEINAETELNLHNDTTVGEDKPMGSRGAQVADHTV